jgi:hypothetical protein
VVVGFGPVYVPWEETSVTGITGGTKDAFDEKVVWASDTTGTASMRLARASKATPRSKVFSPMIPSENQFVTILDKTQFSYV